MSPEPDNATDATPDPASAEQPGSYAAVAVLGAAAVVAVQLGFRSTPPLAVLLGAMVAVSTWLAIIDFREHRLPNRIVGPLALAVTVSVLVGGLVEDDLARAGRALGFGAAMAAVLLIGNLVGGLGMGDVKYGFQMAATVGWFGWDALVVAVLVMTLTAAVAAVVILVQGGDRSRRLAYGPYMALGLVGGLLSAGPW